jgi:hypothetical protein
MVMRVVLAAVMAAGLASPALAQDRQKNERALAECIQINAPLVDDLTSPANVVALAASVLCEPEMLKVARDRLFAGGATEAARRLDHDEQARGRAIKAVKEGDVDAMTLFILQHRVCRRIDQAKEVRPPSCVPFAAGSSSASRP